MVDLRQIIENVVGILPSFETLFMLICWLVGTIFVFLSIRAASKLSEGGRYGGQGGVSGPIATFAVGICFIAMPGLLAGLTQSIFGQATPDPNAIFELAPATVGVLSEGSAARQMVEGLVKIVMFMGMIAVFRGLIALNQAAQSGQGQGVFAHGMTRVISGVLAVNLPLFVGVVEKLLTAKGS